MTNAPAIAEQYRAARRRGGFFERVGRGLIEVSGRDRATWLNNLVTNVVKTLSPGEGNYAFAASIKGRVVFDMNMLVLEDRLWLDVDARCIAAAIKHLDRYVITEDVKLADLSARMRRFAALGPAAVELVTRIGFGNLAPMAQLQHVAGRISDADTRMVRNDFAGLVAAEFFVPADSADAAWALLSTVAGELGLAPLDRAVVEILRIEAGIPASVDDIDEEVVPPETGQIERGICYTKGCYLGQEVIERMRSHNILARKLVGLRVEGAGEVPRGSAVLSEEKEVGRTRSACWSEALRSPLALAYVKTAQAKPDTELFVAAGPAPRRAAVVPLPVAK